MTEVDEHVCRPRDGDAGLTFMISLPEWGDEARYVVRERLCAVCGGLIVDWPIDERGK